jgi:hypothetical protein
MQAGVALFGRSQFSSTNDTEVEDDCPYAQQNGALEVLGLDDLLPPPPMSEMASQPSQVSQLIPAELLLRVCDGCDRCDGFWGYEVSVPRIFKSFSEITSNLSA